jgi:hypothetical protein
LGIIDDGFGEFIDFSACAGVDELSLPASLLIEPPFPQLPQRTLENVLTEEVNSPAFRDSFGYSLQSSLSPASLPLNLPADISFNSNGNCITEQSSARDPDIVAPSVYDCPHPKCGQRFGVKRRLQ